MRYIAYGSNMSQEQMRWRCPDAKLIGVGWVSGARLEFRGRAAGNAHATLIPVRPIKGLARPRVPVAVWDISRSDETRLDYYEGHPNYYRKERWEATMVGGHHITGMIYLMNGGLIGLPSDGYYRGIRDAYMQLGLEDSVGPVLERALEASRVWTEPLPGRA